MQTHLKTQYKYFCRIQRNLSHNVTYRLISTNTYTKVEILGQVIPHRSCKKVHAENLKSVLAIYSYLNGNQD
jgi:hypothetical protein